MYQTVRITILTSVFIVVTGHVGVLASDISVSEPVTDATSELANRQQNSLEPSTIMNPDDGVVLSIEQLNELSEKALADDSSSTEDVEKIKKRFSSAVEWLKRYDANCQAIAQLKREIETSDALATETQRRLEEPLETVVVENIDGQSTDQLETRLLEAQRQHKEAVQELESRESDVKDWAKKKADLIAKLDETQQRINDTHEELKQTPADERSPKELAHRYELMAREMGLQSQLERLHVNTQRQDRMADVFPLLRDLAKRNATRLEKEVSQLVALVARARKQESDAQASAARYQQIVVDPAIRGIAERNTALAERRQDLTTKITDLRDQIAQVDSQIQLVIKRQHDAQVRVELTGRSSAVGLMLRRQRDELPLLVNSREQIQLVEETSPLVYLERLDLDTEQEMLVDVENEKERVLRTLGDHLDEHDAERFGETVGQLLITRRGLVSSLVNDLEQYFVDLNTLQKKHRELIAVTQQFQDYIDERVLWIRSAEPISLATLGNVLRGVGEIVTPQRWSRLFRNTGQAVLTEPWVALGVLLTVVALWGLQQVLDSHIQRICDSSSNRSGARYWPVVQALGIAGIATMEWPILIWYAGRHVEAANFASGLGFAVGAALKYVAELIWLGGFLRLICRPGGIAQTYFSWPLSGLLVVRKNLRWLMLLAVPLAAVVVIAGLFEDAKWDDSMGRLAFTLAMLLLVAFTYRVGGCRNHLLREAIEKQPASWLQQVRCAAVFAGTVIPLMLTALAAAGYYFSARQLALRLQATTILALSGVILHALASRWLVVKRRRLALEQAKLRSQQGTRDTDEMAPSLVNDPPDWNEIHGRLRMLLRHALTVFVLIGIWSIWSDVLPALKILDRIELWSQSVTVTQVYEDKGEVLRSETVKEVPTTLRHGVIAMIAVLATLILGKNLPALLEITLLNRLPLDRGGRHAVSVILRYALGLTGAFLAFRTLNIQWSSIQWLAAAVTVGLGFGLQEIFANFVSGIILLFERPIRVGDVITLDDVTGTVTDIQIRATTVTNWDRKELIVPNKELITGRLLNWTLTDTTNRLVIEVGIAYGSDANAARVLMLETVSAHEKVLNDPTPIVSFESFGDSSLNFVIRCYLASLEGRLETLHQLHADLHRALNEAGYEIPFPQRDINVRGLDLMAGPSMGPDELPQKEPAGQQRAAA